MCARMEYTRHMYVYVVRDNTDKVSHIFCRRQLSSLSRCVRWARKNVEAIYFTTHEGNFAIPACLRAVMIKIEEDLLTMIFCVTEIEPKKKIRTSC